MTTVEGFVYANVKVFGRDDPSTGTRCQRGPLPPRKSPFPNSDPREEQRADDANCENFFNSRPFNVHTKHPWGCCASRVVRLRVFGGSLESVEVYSNMGSKENR